MFNKGDFCFYGQTGVCKITDVSEKELIRGIKKLYYTLTPVYQQNNVIYAPAENGKVFMREILDKAAALELASRVPEIINADTATETEEDYKKLLDHHRPEDLLMLASRLYTKKQSARAVKKKIGFTDEKYLKRAEELLFGELAVALDTTPDQIPDILFKNI